METANAHSAGGGWVADKIQVSEGPSRATGTGGGAWILLLPLLLVGGYRVGAGYVLSAQMVWAYWAGGVLSDHRWDRITIYVFASLFAVGLIARTFGFLTGAAVGVLPALPLYYATKGGVGFWWIVSHAEKALFDNVATSWVVFIGMLAIHWAIAWAVQRRDEPFRYRMLRWRWITTPGGIVCTIVVAAACIVATSTIQQAIDAFETHVTY